MKLSVLIPFRDADGTRTPGHQWMLQRWQHFYPDAEFIIEPDDGIDPFNKSLAVNKAAAKATGDVFIVLDADTWLMPPPTPDVTRRNRRYVPPAVSPTHWMDEALADIERGRAWVIPARRHMRLRQDISQRILKMDPTGPFPRISSRDTESAGPVVGFLWVIPRRTWEKVGGMDERIRGWGGEDTFFTKAANSLAGTARKLPGVVVCLWHARPRDGGRRIWVGQDRTNEHGKRSLAVAYGRASNKDKMRDLLSQEGGPLWLPN